MATDDDIIQFDDDVNIYPVYFSRAIIIYGNRLKVTAHSNNRNSKSSREVILGSVRL